MHAVAERQLYILSVRAILLLLAAVFLLSAASGALASWVVFRRAFHEQAGGVRVVERVERVTGATDRPVAEAVEHARGGVVGVLDGRGGVLQAGMILTADGIGITPTHARLPRPPQVLLPDGSRRPAAILREYPEKGLLFFRVSGSFPAPELAGASAFFPGVPGILVRPVAESRAGAARQVSVEYVTPVVSGEFVDAPGVERMGVLSDDPGARYHGAPLFSYEKKLLGITVRLDAGGSLILSSDVDLLLQDVLRHPEGDVISVLGGMRGRWVVGEEAARESLPGEIGFRVERPPEEFLMPEGPLRRGDIITGLDGKPLPGAGSLWGTLLEGARSGKPVTLDVHQETEERTVVLAPRV